MKNGQGSLMIQDEHGGSLVEFAIVMPLLFVILFGIIEFGILLYDKAMITNASREGARAGIVFDATLRNEDNTINSEGVKARVQDAVDAYLTNVDDNVYLISFGSGSTYSVNCSDVNLSGDPLTVTVSYRFDFLAFSGLITLLGGDLADFLNLNAETVMRME